ncbi:alpha/beta hydrolase [Cohnella sp. 56]|uniref:alpha/beta hydrolase n=1 Tax=Cohnella sp. 56 TaxID=3113722 RepID=UPI0030E8D0DC
MSGAAADGLRMAGIAEHTLTARANGREYVIKIALPADEPPARGYPVLYALDADATFLTMAEAVRLQTRRPHGYDPAVVVGIGYPSREPFDMTRRCYDFTMPAAGGTLPERPDGRPWPEHGGADLFLGFIERELIPFVDGRFKTDPGRRTLYGHSLGGLLALHAFFAGSAQFAGYAAGSPSIWWGDYAVLREMEAFAGRADAGKRSRLLMMVGADELAHMVADAVSLHNRLGGLRQVDSAWTAELVRFADEEHVSVLPAAISRSIRFALAATAD